MTILSAMQKASMRLISRKPSVFFGASAGQTFEQEISDLVNEVAEDIQKYQDWQALTQTFTLTGDGTKTDFDFPDDYDRMLIDTEIQAPEYWAWGFQQLDDINAFIFAQTRGPTIFPGNWIITADKLKFYPAPPAGQDAIFPYISKNYAKASNGTLKAAFTADSDEYRLPERLLTLGLVWRWRENKKLDSTGDLEAFRKALDEYAGKDKGPFIYRSNSRGYGRYGRFYPAWPFPLG